MIISSIGRVISWLVVLSMSWCSEHVTAIFRVQAPSYHALKIEVHQKVCPKNCVAMLANVHHTLLSSQTPHPLDGHF